MPQTVLGSTQSQQGLNLKLTQCGSWLAHGVVIDEELVREGWGGFQGLTGAEIPPQLFLAEWPHLLPPYVRKKATLASLLRLVRGQKADGGGGGSGGVGWCMPGSACVECESETGKLWSRTLFFGFAICFLGVRRLEI